MKPIRAEQLICRFLAVNYPMKLHSKLIIIIMTSFVFQSNAAIPFYPRTVQAVTDEDIIEDGKTRLRINLSNSETGNEENVLLGPLTVCSNSQCYRPATPVSVKFSDTTSGTSEVVVDMAIPYDEIQTIHFDDVAGVRSIHGEIKLINPLRLDPLFRGEEILVILKKTKENQRIVFVPDQVVTGILGRDGQSVYYNPKFKTTIRLPLDTKVIIPSEATDLPQIFNMSTIDTGNKFPYFDIFPPMVFKKKITVSTTPVTRKFGEHGSNSTTRSNTSGGATDNQRKTREVQSLETGIIEFDEDTLEEKGDAANSEPAMCR